MTIYEARQRNIPVRDIGSYDLTEEEKLVYIFEHRQEEVRKFDVGMYYCLLCIADKYK